MLLWLTQISIIMTFNRFHNNSYYCEFLYYSITVNLAMWPYRTAQTYSYWSQFHVNYYEYLCQSHHYLLLRHKNPVLLGYFLLFWCCALVVYPSSRGDLLSYQEVSTISEELQVVHANHKCIDGLEKVTFEKKMKTQICWDPRCFMYDILLRRLGI